MNYVCNEVLQESCVENHQVCSRKLQALVRPLPLCCVAPAARHFHPVCSKILTCSAGATPIKCVVHPFLGDSPYNTLPSAAPQYLCYRDCGMGTREFTDECLRNCPEEVCNPTEHSWATSTGVSAVAGLVVVAAAWLQGWVHVV